MKRTTDPLLFSRFEYFAQCTSHTLSDPVRKIIAICESSKHVGVVEEEAKRLLETIKALRKYSFFILKPPKLKPLKTALAIDEALDILQDKGVAAAGYVAFQRESMPHALRFVLPCPVLLPSLRNACECCPMPNLP